MPTVSSFNLGNIGAIHSKQAEQLAKAEYVFFTKEGQEESKKAAIEQNQRKASLFALRKTGKSLGYSSSSVFGGGGSTKEINEIGVTLG